MLFVLITVILLVSPRGKGSKGAIESEISVSASRLPARLLPPRRAPSKAFSFFTL